MLPPHRPFKDKPVKRAAPAKKKAPQASAEPLTPVLDPVARSIAPRRMITPAASPVAATARKDKLLSVKSKALTG